MIEFQAIKLAHSIFTQAIIPTLVFASLMFLPLGIGLGVIAAGLAITAITYLILRQCEPKRQPIEDFDLDVFNGEFGQFEERFEDQLLGRTLEDADNVTEKDLVELFGKKPKSLEFFSSETDSDSDSDSYYTDSPKNNVKYYSDSEEDSNSEETPTLFAEI